MVLNGEGLLDDFVIFFCVSAQYAHDVIEAECFSRVFQKRKHEDILINLTKTLETEVFLIPRCHDRQDSRRDDRRFPSGQAYGPIVPHDRQHFHLSLE